MKRLACLIMWVLTVFSLTSCGSEKAYRISYDLPGEPANLDPQTAVDTSSLTVINNIFEGLFSISDKGEPENALALSYEKSGDGLTYTFLLRKDAVWSGRDEDGKEILTPVTAHDFEFAFRRLLRPSTASPAAAQYYCIRNAEAVHKGEMDETQLGVKALSDDKLQITLSVPNDHFLYLLAATYASPCNEEFFNATRGKYGLEPSTIMANGAFDLRSWRHSESVKLIRNENYYDAAQVLPDGVNLWIPDIPEGSDASQTAASRLGSESIDGAVIKGKDMDPLSGKGYQSEPIENAVWGLLLNQKNPALKNSEIRRAIACAFDRKSYSGHMEADLSEARALIPHSVTYYGMNFREFAGNDLTQQFDAAIAYEHYKAGLDELNESGISGLRLLVNADEGKEASEYFLYASQILQKELSLFISVDQLPEKEYNARLKSGQFDIALCSLQAADNTPWSLLSRFMSGDPRNYISYRNEALDQLLNLTISNATGREALEACQKAERMILEDAAFIPMYYSTDYFVTRPDVSGLVYNAQTGLVSFRSAALA